jgi:predicted site-specific integrase-resolvase
MTSDLITEIEAAKLLGVSHKALKTWRYAGDSPSFYRLSSKTIRYDPDIVKKWLETKALNKDTDKEIK